MSISDHWPNIHVRLKATSDALIHYHSQKRKVDLSFALSSTSNIHDTHNPYTDANNYGSLTQFYSSLLDIVGLLCELADDFMIGRLENDIWPIMSSIISDYIRQLPTTTKNRTKHKRNTTKTTSYSDQPVEIISTLKCLSRIFSTRKCGVRLIAMLPSVCTLILPMLSLQGIVGESTMKTIQSLLYIDISSLYRSIYDLCCEEKLRRNPLVVLFKKEENDKDENKKIIKLSMNDNASYSDRSNAASPDSRLKLRTQALLKFIENIKEQPLV